MVPVSLLQPFERLLFPSEALEDRCDLENWFATRISSEIAALLLVAIGSGAQEPKLQGGRFRIVGGSLSSAVFSARISCFVLFYSSHLCPVETRLDTPAYRTVCRNWGRLNCSAYWFFNWKPGLVVTVPAFPVTV